MEWEYEYNQLIDALRKEIAEKDKENAELKESKAKDEETIADLKEENRRLREQKGETEDERDKGTDNTGGKE